MSVFTELRVTPLTPHRPAEVTLVFTLRILIMKTDIKLNIMVCFPMVALEILLI